MIEALRRLRRGWLLAALGGALTGALAVPAAADAPPGPLHPALWVVKDADTTIYLFGTVHALPHGMEWLEGPLAAALDSSDELVSEIVDPDPAAMQSAVLTMAMLPAGQNLRGLLDPAQKSKFEAALTGLGLAKDAFDRFKPWYAAVALATLPLLREGLTMEDGVEAALAARPARTGPGLAGKRPRTALETAQFQLGLFDSLPLANQLNYLSSVMDALPAMKTDTATMIAEWGLGHPDKLADLLDAEEDDPLIMDRLVTQRNKTWATWIHARLARPGTVFVAVGAGHLAGEQSVQHQLAGQGITTTRVQ